MTTGRINQVAARSTSYIQSTFDFYTHLCARCRSSESFRARHSDSQPPQNQPILHVGLCPQRRSISERHPTLLSPKHENRSTSPSNSTTDLHSTHDTVPTRKSMNSFTVTLQTRATSPQYTCLHETRTLSFSTRGD